MFTQRISMDCTREQYEKYLKDELLKMGYVEEYMYWGRCPLVFTNAANGVTGNMLDIDWEDKERYGRTYLGSFNAPLFLALAAMTDKAEGSCGEYWRTSDPDLTYLNDWYKQDIVKPNSYWRKATKEEIMAKFGKIEPDTNYDAAREFAKNICDNITKLRAGITLNIIKNVASDAKEQLDAISLLKSKGYKILCKKETWEEV